MTTQYTNSVSYLQHRNEIEADKLGYINSVLYGASFMGMVPIVPANDFMQDIHFERKQGTEKRSQKRKLNEELSSGTFNPFEKKTELTAIFSTQPTSIDYRLAERDPAQFDRMLERDAQDLIMDIDYDIINGVPDSSGYGILGLKSRIPVGSDYNVDNASALTINTSATTFKTFLRQFRSLVRKIKMAPGMQLAAFCNESVDLAVQSGRDELGANVVGVGTTDIMNQRVTTIDNIPLVITRGDSIGTEILAFDETASTTSIFIVGFGGTSGEGTYKLPQGMVILSSDEVIRDRDFENLTQIQAVQEIDIGLRVPKRSVARLSGLKAQVS